MNYFFYNEQVCTQQQIHAVHLRQRGIISLFKTIFSIANVIKPKTILTLKDFNHKSNEKVHIDTNRKLSMKFLARNDQNSNTTCNLFGRRSNVAQKVKVFPVSVPVNCKQRPKVETSATRSHYFARSLEIIIFPEPDSESESKNFSRNKDETKFCDCTDKIIIINTQVSLSTHKLCQHGRGFLTKKS